jgi:putative restriction endonuclease
VTGVQTCALPIWQGQLSGRTDALIVNHKADGNRILIFYRRSKREYAGAGFRLEGEFEYVSSTPGKPTTFVLKRTSWADAPCS